MQDENDIYRLDSSFFNKTSINIEHKIKEQDFMYLKKNEIVSGPFGSTIPSNYYLELGDIPFIRIENIKDDFFVNRKNMVYINIENNNRIKNSQLYENDLIMSKVGNSIGHFAMVDSDMNTCNISENNIGIKLKAYNKEFKYYLCAYLNSKIANNLILRRISGNAQPKLNVADMMNIPIPKFSNNLYNHIAQKIALAYKLQKDADNIFKESIELLENELQYNCKYVPNNNISTNKLSNVLKNNFRIDAEFYQEKYQYYNELIRKYKGGYDTIGNSCIINDKNYLPKNEEKYKYIELANIKNNGEIDAVEEIQGSKLPTRARRKVTTGQVIISSIEGSLESCALINPQYNDSICSTGFYIIESNKINSETLFILFKTKILQEILQQQASGTILTSISKKDFWNINIPIFEKNIQKTIMENVQNMFILRKKSNSLLEIAKKLVEIAIEKNEDEAIKYINQSE